LNAIFESGNVIDQRAEINGCGHWCGLRHCGCGHVCGWCGLLVRLGCGLSGPVSIEVNRIDAVRAGLIFRRW
jgi:hypothetical protein